MYSFLEKKQYNSKNAAKITASYELPASEPNGTET
jgi:hypothetical protein